MNPEDVVPPSPQVNVDKKLSGRMKRKSGRRSSKSKHPIQSLRLKNLEKSNGNDTDGLLGVSATLDISPIQETLYFNRDDDDSVEKQQHTGMPTTNEYDVLAPAKLIEQCNQYDLSQNRQQSITQNNLATHRISASQSFCSLATLLTTQRHANENQLRAHSPDNSDTSPLDAVAKEISQENLQFSEWPTDLRDTSWTNGQAQIGGSFENSSASSIVHSILRDFCDVDDDDDNKQDETAQTPSFILIRRAQPKTYKHSPSAQYKKLLFDEGLGDSGAGGGDNRKDNCDRDNSVVSRNSVNKKSNHELDRKERCDKDDDDDDDDIDIDLNASRAIVENLTKLSTFFTQSQSHELDFNVDLSQHTIPDFEKRFDNFGCDSDDDFHNDQVRINYSNSSDIEVEAVAANSAAADVVTAAEVEATNGDSNNSLFIEHDDFEKFVTHIETPKGLMQCSKSGKRNVNQASMSISSVKTGIEDSGMHSTPSTSKISATLNDHRVAKRLQFAAETNAMEISAGFSLASARNAADDVTFGFATARGGAIQLTDKAMKRAAGTFADIDCKYKHVDPTTDEPQLKRIKTTGKSVTFKGNESCFVTPERPKAKKTGGFQLASGKNPNLPRTAAAKARDIFGEDLGDLDLGFGEPSAGFKPTAIAGPSNLPGIGFATARGTNIAVKTNNMQRYAKILDEVNHDVCKETDMINGENSNFKKSRNIFDEDLSDLDGPTSGFKTIAIAGPSKLPEMGFATARGTNIAVKTTNMQRYAKILDEVKHADCEEAAVGNDASSNFDRSRDMFDESLSDLDSNEPTNGFGPSKLPEMGFKTARGSNIAVTTTNMQRYAMVFDEIDGDISELADTANDTDFSLNQNALECKTPLAKANHHRRPDAFTTSTPNPNVTPGFKCVNLPPITPITKQIQAELQDFKSWTIAPDFEFDKVFTQQQTNSICPENQSINDTGASDLQQSIEGSFTESSGIDVIGISDAVKCARRKALSEQQSECFKKPHTVCQLIGGLFLQKVMPDMELHDLGTPKSYSREELKQLGVQANVIDVNVDNVSQFKFDMWNFYPLHLCQTNVDGIDLADGFKLLMDENARVGAREITSAFLQCSTTDPKLIPDHWITNSLKWIIIKLASYERSFPHKFGGRSLTPENVVAQLKYRYDREIDKVERSAIRRIVERDDTPAKRMILFVSRIQEQSLVYSIELSDGWYAIRTHSLDTVLSSAISRRKIVVGTKLVIQGAELMGIEEGCSPLEMPRSVALKIHGNSTRRAKWHAKLGYCKESWPFAVSLNSIHGNGGTITRATAYIVRVYPLIFAIKEKTGDGQKTVYRSNKVEQRESKKDDRKHFEMYEKVYSEAAAEIEKEYEAMMKKHKSPRKRLSDIDDGEELWNFMEHSSDGISFEFDLTATQKKMLNDYQTKFFEEKQNKIEAIVKKKLKQLEGPEKSRAIQKVRLMDATAPDVQQTAILSIWNANEAQIPLRENTLLDLRYVTTNGERGKDVLLTAGNMTVLREVRPFTTTVHCAFTRQLTPISEIDAQQFKPIFNEFDTLGMVVKVDEAMSKHFQSVFVADANQNLLCVKFWNGIKHHAYEDIVKEKAVIVICQLDWRSHDRLNLNGVPQAFVSEITTFSENPKSTERIYALNCLREQFDRIDLNTFIEECGMKLRQNNHSNKENSTSNSTFNTSSNQSMLSRTAPASTAVAAASKPTPDVLQRVDLLRKYGSPPPLPKAYLKMNRLDRTMVNKPFKNPCKQTAPTDS